MKIRNEKGQFIKGYHPPTEFKKGQFTGENHYEWKGDKVSYSGLHHWIKKILGSPKKCEKCKKDNLIGHQIQWANKSSKYKRDLKDWIRLCAKCHHKYDKISEKLWKTRRKNNYD